MINLRGRIDEYIPEFISFGMVHLISEEPKVKSLKVHLMEVVINAVYYNPLLALHVLESNGWTNKFFSHWFSNIDSFTRVHDKKLSIAAITSLLTLGPDQIPVTVQPGWPRLLQGIVRLFQTLPAAMKNREEATKEDAFDLSNEYEDEEEEDWEAAGGDWENEADEAEDVKDESTAYLEFLNEEAQKFNQLHDDDDGDLEEESLLETALDKVEPYGMFKEALLQLQSSQPQLYENLTKNLSPEEQQVIQGAVQHADVVAHQAQIEAAQLAAAEQTNGQNGAAVAGSSQT